MSDPSSTLGVVEIADAVASGRLSAGRPTHDALTRIAALDDKIGAWAFVDPDLAERRAEILEVHRRNAIRQSRRLGALHGVPIGLKDIIDTDDMPTENGTSADAGRRPPRNAAIVNRLRAAGAVTIGKTVTTELAYLNPSSTRNPHDPERTPGGSSSGSAAAVAAGMVPAAIGTQTGGSILRPASFCGVVGYKPSFGAVGRGGVLMTSRSLDTLGVFARSIGDAAAVAETVFGADDRDPWSVEISGAGLRAATEADPPATPRLGFFQGPAWDRAEASTHAAFAELCDALGPIVEPVSAPAVFAETLRLHRTVMAAEIAAHVGRYADRTPELMSAAFNAIVEEGRKVDAVAYLDAIDLRERFAAELGGLLERYDALITPAAAGEAPMGLGSTGDSSFCQFASFVGAPAISVPLLSGPNGLPLGVQFVGARFDDARLLRAASWSTKRLAEL